MSQRPDFGREKSALFTSWEGNCYSPPPPPPPKKKTLFSMVTRWSRAMPLSYLRLVKIWHGSSCGKFVQHLETCLLIAEADRVLCRLILLCFNRLFAVELQSEYICYQICFVIHGWRVCKVFVWEMRRLTKKKSELIVFKNKLFILFHLTGCVRTFKCLTWWFSGAESRLVTLSNYIAFDVCLFVCFLVSWSRALFMPSLCTRL